MPSRSQEFGTRGEAEAVRLLKRQGYRILERNYRTRLGEIDIIAKDRHTIVFIEVKTRRTGRFGSPKAAVTPLKQRRLSKTALTYLKSTRQTSAHARFDVVAIDTTTGGGHEIIRNAFEFADS